MARFQTFDDLSIADQQEITRILAISSGQRNSVETAFLAARADYLYNGIDLKDEDGNIVIAHGHTLPTNVEGFVKGAIFRKTNTTDGSHPNYENLGDETGATWDGVGIADEAESAPVNAVNSFQTLTVSSITAGKHAKSVLTSDGTNVADAATVTIGSIVYTFKDTMAAAYDVKRGADAATSLANLKKAINGTGVAGTDYFAGTVAHTLVRANEIDATTLTIWSRTVGTANNTLATTETSSHLSWEDTTLGGGTGASVAGVAAPTVTIGAKTYSIVNELSETSGAAAVANQVLYGGTVAAALDNLKLAINAGAGAGTNYSTGTTAHTEVSATTNTDTTQVVEALTAGVIGDGIATTETLANGSWGAATTAGGVDGTVGEKGEQIFTSSYLYTAIDDNTIADKNWRRVSLGSAY